MFLSLFSFDLLVIFLIYIFPYVMILFRCRFIPVVFLLVFVLPLLLYVVLLVFLLLLLLLFLLHLLPLYPYFLLLCLFLLHFFGSFFLLSLSFLFPPPPVAFLVFAS